MIIREFEMRNFYFFYRSQLNEPSPEVIIQKLNVHPYINFRDNLSEGINMA
jgi:hypothetical protein